MTNGQFVEMIAVAMTLAATLFAIGLLLVQRVGRRDQTLYLVAFLGLCALVKADWLVYLTGGYIAVPQLAGLVFPFKTMLGPVFYVYVRSMTAASPQPLRRSDAWALSGPALIFLIMSRFFFLSSEQKAGLISLHYPDPELRDWAFMACKLTFLAFLAVSLVYLAAAYRLVRNHVSRLRDLFSNIEDKSLAWIRWALFILAGGWAWYSLGEIWGIQGSRPAWYPVLTACFDLGWIGLIAFFGLVQRPVLDTVPSEPPSDDKTRYARSLLTEDRLCEIEDRLAHAMQHTRLYTDPNLSLRRLSDRLRISEDHLSQTFSRKIGANFFEYINRHRVAEARQRLTDTDDSIVNIAYDVGFNSRSTFNAAFKAQAGMAPSAFRRQARAQAALTAPSPS